MKKNILKTLGFSLAISFCFAAHAEAAREMKLLSPLGFSGKKVEGTIRPDALPGLDAEQVDTQGQTPDGLTMTDIGSGANKKRYRVTTKAIGFGVAVGDSNIEDIAHGGGAANVPNVNEGYYAQDEAGLELAISQIIEGSVRSEVCNDLDDDCDTRIDEDFPNKGAACDNGLLGVCKGTGSLGCTADGPITPIRCAVFASGRASFALRTNTIERSAIVRARSLLPGLSNVTSIAVRGAADHSGSSSPSATFWRSTRRTARSSTSSGRARRCNWVCSSPGSMRAWSTSRPSSAVSWPTGCWDARAPWCSAPR